ncbi:hypothetical protein [Streptacidiphilus sp. P02-A3a]|uniref:hypothetical protein n=1 Tax=Streptacidiphilus sp. P02-A3a TaxID=2704468 RepID=UPI0015F9DFD0|nr:hypothetical protein [Streptacidiphilus sp. P02-A3a]QMU71834.1 hypothetical protein GXP74_29945 [Streptacidiphilus sp. P02-A3a]
MSGAGGLSEQGPQFDQVMALQGHDVPDDLRPGVLAVHLELKRMTSLLRTASLAPEAEPAHVFSVATYLQEP